MARNFRGNKTAAFAQEDDIFLGGQTIGNNSPSVGWSGIAVCARVRKQTFWKKNQEDGAKKKPLLAKQIASKLLSNLIGPLVISGLPAD